MQIRADSTEYGVATITTSHDISGAMVEVALPLTGNAPQDWYVAEVTGVTQANGKWTATYRLLIGPTGTVTLAAGTYDWLVRVTDSPEMPVRKAGTVTAS